MGDSHLCMEQNSKRLTPSQSFFLKKNWTALWIMLCGGMTGLLFMGQTSIPSDSITPSEWIVSGQKYWQQQNLDSAYIAFRTAQRMADSQDDLKMWAMATQLSGMYLSRHMRLAEASETLDSVIAISDQLDSLNKDVFFARRERAYVDLMRNDLAAAQQQYEALLSDYQNYPAAFDSLKAEAYQVLGQAYFYGGKYQKGLQSSLEALALYESIFDKDNMAIAICLNTVAIMQMYMSQYEEALASFQRSEDIMIPLLGDKHEQLIQIRTNIGVLYGELGLFWESLDYHRQNLSHLDQLPPSPHLNALLNMGGTLIGLGEYEEALRYLDEAEKFLDAHPDMTPSNYAHIDLQRSLVFRELGEGDTALFFIQSSLLRQRDIFGNDHPELIADLFQLGELQVDLLQFKQAENTFQEALGLTTRHLGPTSLRKGHALYFLGKTKQAQGKKQEALELFDQAQQAYLANGNRFDRAKASSERATIWREDNNWDSTQVMHQQAWHILWPEIPFQWAPDSSILRHWSDHSATDLLLTQAQSLQRHYQEDQQIPTLAAALTCYERMLAIADSQLLYFQSPASRSYWRKESLPHIETALRIAEQLFRLTGEVRFVHRAFQLAENSKSGNLRTHLRRQQAMQFAGVPDSLIQEERFFQQRLLALTDELNQVEASTSEWDSLKQKHFDLHESYREYREQLKQKYPRYFQLKYPASISFSAEIQASLQESEAMYSYFWGEKYLFVFRVLKQEMSIYQLAIDEVLLSSLTQWIRFISSPPSKQEADVYALAAIGAGLKPQLLPGLHQEIRSVSIIPHGLLGYLPLESLLAEVPSSNNMRDWAFLGRDWTMSYAYAAELWIQQRQSFSSGSVQYMGFAPGFDDHVSESERAALGALLYNEQEVKTSAELMNGQAFIGNQAQESLLKEKRKGTYLFHFATHAIAEEEDLMRSRLYLSADTANEEDGILYAYEIYGLSLQSPLTILSACQTGGGALQRGEGIMSLARAFQYAGSEQILTTLWRADDRSGADISTDFLTNIWEQRPAEEALKLARNNWLEQSDSYHCHPYFWAGYILIGQGDSLDIGAHLPFYRSLFCLGALVLLLIGARFIWMQTKQS